MMVGEIINLGNEEAKVILEEYMDEVHEFLERSREVVSQLKDADFYNTDTIESGIITRLEIRYDENHGWMAKETTLQDLLNEAEGREV